MNALMLLASLAMAQDLAIVGETVYPVSGEPIANGVVLIEQGRITAVGADLDIPEGTRTMKGAVVTPGLIDGLSVIGLSGVQNRSPDQDHRETYEPRLADLRALDGFHPGDALVAYVKEFGVTTVRTGPSPGVPVGGRSLVVSTHGTRVDDMALVADGAMLFSLGEAPKSAGQGRGRMAAAATIRQALSEGQQYGQGLRVDGKVDLGLQALAEVVDGSRQAIFHAHRADDIVTALRIAEEFGLDAQVVGASEAWLVTEELAAAEVPVLLGPIMSRSWFEGELRNSNFEAAAILRDAGVTVGFIGGFEGYVPKVRLVGFEAAIAAGNGLGMEDALRAVTLTNAVLLGIDDKVGSLEAGKRADIVLWDGDPFETTTHACSVVVGGEVVSTTCR